ncbi:serine/threonine protein kinase [Paenibacillus sp. CN-4]|uniref:serine/threonine protein kinase n=1 Tax=Paenibacillus nanchangensis TaxID=3348343 RepID=UPI00397B2A19
MEIPLLDKGTLLGGRYRVAAELGKGGMSRVYLADDLRLPGQRWAVKISPAGGAERGQLASEASLLIALQHPRLPRVVDWLMPEGEDWTSLVMDYIPGDTLEQLYRRTGEAAGATELVNVAEAVLDILTYLHSRQPPVVYRDVKPSNLMIDADGTIKLIDFGIARSYHPNGSGDTTRLGTVGFAAPESYTGNSDPRSDLYGLGALLLSLATRGAFTEWGRGAERALHGVLPAALTGFIRRLLRKNPGDRYASASDALRCLRELKPNAAGEESGGRVVRSSVTAAPNQSACKPSRQISGSTGGKVGVEGAEAFNIGGRISIHDGISINGGKNRGKRAGSFDPKRTAVVAFLGAAPGLGTTSASLAAARYLSGLGPAVWVELNPAASAYRRLRGLSGAPETPGPDGEAVFRLGGFDCARRTDRPYTEFYAGLLAGYRWAIFDLGSRIGAASVQGIVAAAEVSVLIASGADWRLEETVRCAREFGRYTENLVVALPLAGKETAGLVQSMTEVRVHGLPCVSEPLESNLDQRIWEALLLPLLNGPAVRNP